MSDQRALWIFRLALAGLMSGVAFAFLPGYRVWVFASLVHIAVACTLIRKWQQRNVLVTSFAACTGVARLAASLTLPSGNVREEGYLLLVFSMIGALAVAGFLYQEQRAGAA